jgi:hypothetical protein
MIILEHHIYELQVELRGCWMTRSERAEAQAELAEALERHANCTNDFDEVVTAEIKGRGG